MKSDKHVHYSISPNEQYVALCGRFSGNICRNREEVTCKDCLQRMASKDYSDSQFVRDEDRR